MGVGTMQQGLQLGRAMGPTLNRTEESGNLQAGSRQGGQASGWKMKRKHQGKEGFWLT